jgi:3-hydroxymyristoyl/3-hydroxydecanoyl-(acyl carrier protein) dehydratase
MPEIALPHTYPFRFIDAVAASATESPSNSSWQGSVRARLSTNSWAARDGGAPPSLLFAEMIAQAALLLEGGDPEAGRRGFLAGIDGFEVVRQPRAGDSLSISVRLAARFGAVLKFEGEVESSGETIARGAVLVRKGDR